MFGKLAEAQQKAEEVKQKLEAISVEGTAGNVKIVSTGNKRVYEIVIADELMTIERKEELQELLLIAIENAMTAAENVSQSEMQALMSTMMPGGLGNLFGKK